MVLVDAETGEHEPKHEMERLFLWTELQEPEQEILLAETVNELALDEDFIAGNSSEMWEKLSHALVWEVTFRGWVLVKQITYRQAKMFYRQPYVAWCYGHCHVVWYPSAKGWRVASEICLEVKYFKACTESEVGVDSYSLADYFWGIAF